MLRPRPQALIVGGGVAGLASAIALGRRGWRCTILERDPRHRRPGHGILLPHCGQQTLEQLGVEGIGAASAAISAFELHDRDGSPLQRFPIAGSLALLHRDLLALLGRALPPGITVVDRRGIGLEEGADGRLQVMTDDGQRWRGQLIVAADGVRSACRRALFPQARLTPELVTEIVLDLHAPALVRHLAGTCRKFLDPGGGLALGLMPCRNGQLVVFAQFATALHPAVTAATSAAFLRQRFGGWTALLDDVLRDLHTSSAHIWHTTDLDPLPRLHQGHVVLVGDSAHPLLTFTSQGTATALAGALRIRDALDGVDPWDHHALSAALARYSASRLPELARLVREGREKRRQFLSPGQRSSRPLAPLVDFGVALAAAA